MGGAVMDTPTRQITSAEQLLEVDFSDYDRILLVPVGNQGDPEFDRDWQWERDKVVFCQAALGCDVSFDELRERTKPYFADLWLPPEVASLGVKDMGAYPVFYMALETPAQWLATVIAHAKQLAEELEKDNDDKVRSGVLKRLPRRRKSNIDDQTANVMAAKHYFHGVRWADLALAHPPPGGYRGNPNEKKKQQKSRAAHIQLRVEEILSRLSLPLQKLT